MGCVRRKVPLGPRKRDRVVWALGRGITSMSKIRSVDTVCSMPPHARRIAQLFDSRLPLIP